METQGWYVEGDKKLNWDLYGLEREPHILKEAPGTRPFHETFFVAHLNLLTLLQGYDAWLNMEVLVEQM